MRKLFFWLHLTAGCIGGLVIGLMSLTGVLLTYEKQLTAWIDRGPYRVAGGGTALEPEQLMDAWAKQKPAPAPGSTVTLRSDPTEPAELNLGRDGTFFLNPYTGQVLGRNAGSGRAMVQKVMAWHRWLGVETNGPGRATAKAITGACNLAFLFLVLSGAYLWIPRQWSAQYLRPVTWFRSGLTGKARDFNWHNTFGIWALVPLFFVVLTALPISYPWAGNAIYSMTGTKPPPPPPRLEPAPGDTQGLNDAWRRAREQQPGWVAISGPALVSRTQPLTFNIDSGSGGQPQKRATLTLNPADFSVARWQTFADGNSGQRLRLWSRFTHTGEAFGLLGQTIAGLGSLAGVMLVWTGISLALRRFAAWRARRSRSPELAGATRL